MKSYNKKILRLSIVLSLSLLLQCIATQCTPSIYYYYPHYITDLARIKETSLKSRVDLLEDNEKTGQKCLFFAFFFNNTTLPHDRHLPKHPNIDDSNYLTSIGDHGYQRRRPGCNYRYRQIALRYPVSAISITCDKELTSGYPAGRELKDLFLIEFEDIYGYIKSGYQQEKKLKGKTISLDEKEIRESMVMGGGIDFIVKEYPTALIGEEATFKVIITLSNNQKFQSEVTFKL